MTQQERELLLKDLCARLPYGVRVKNSRRRKPVTLSLDVMTDFHLGCSIKPYLRTMSSMTEEEKKEFDEITLIHTPWGIQIDRIHKLIDWLNSHHFDFRNLIERGLAIDCTDLNVY